MWSAVFKLKHVWSLVVQMEPRVMDGYPHVALFLHKTLRSLKTPNGGTPLYSCLRPHMY